MNEPLVVEAPSYFELDQTAIDTILRIKTISPKAKVMVFIEDDINSIIRHDVSMNTSDVLGLLHIMLIRIEEHERLNFINRSAAANKLEESRVQYLNDQTEKGNVN